MKKGILLLVLMSFFISEIFAQQEKTPMLTSHPKIELGFQGLGGGYEFALGKKFILDVNAGLGQGYSLFYMITIGYRLEITNPAFYAITEFRYYYSLAKRLAKNKNWGNNAGNYLGVQIKYDIPEVFNNTYKNDIPDLGHTLLTEVHWGFQRNLGKKFVFNMHFGLGYAYSYAFVNSTTPLYDDRFTNKYCADEYCIDCCEISDNRYICENGTIYFAIGVKFGYMF